MSRCAWVVVLGLLLSQAVEAQRSAAATEISDPAAHVWTVLHRFEVAALRDYEHHASNSDVRQRGELLWVLSRSPDFQSLRDTCGAAAQHLSFMVTGYYESRQRHEIALDWHHYAKRYIERRGACIANLRLDPTRFPLPRWFGS